VTTTKSIAVKILGKDYQVACTEDQVHSLINAALLLDGKMKDIKATGRIVGLERIAVMAALNLAHELLTFKDTANFTQQEYDQRVVGMCDRIENALILT